MSDVVDREALLEWLRDRSPKARIVLVPRRVDAPMTVNAGLLIDAIERSTTGNEFHFPVCNCGLPWPHEDGS